MSKNANTTTAITVILTNKTIQINVIAVNTIVTIKNIFSNKNVNKSKIANKIKNNIRNIKVIKQHRIKNIKSNKNITEIKINKRINEIRTEAQTEIIPNKI